MGGKYGMGGNYQRFDNGGKGDPKKKKKDKNKGTKLVSSYTYTTPEVYTEGPRHEFEYTTGTPVPQWSTSTYVPGETTTTTTDYMSEDQARPYLKARATASRDGKVIATGGQEISATSALLNRLKEDKLQTRIVDDEGNEITNEYDWKRFRDKKNRDLVEDYEKGLIDIKTYQEQKELLDGVSDSFADIIQSQGTSEATKNLYGDIAKKEDPEAHVAETLKRESHWFNPNDPQFGPGGFDVHNPGHVMIYQMKFNHLAAPGEEIRVDGKWGGETDSASVPISTKEREELGGGVDPELEMRFTEEKPKGGWEHDGGGRPGGGGGGGYNPGRVRGGGGGGNIFGECKKGMPCAAHLEEGGVMMKTRFKDGGVYYMK